MISFMADLMPDDAANGCATDTPDRAATRQDGTSGSTDGRTDGGIFVLRRHAGTPTKTEQDDCEAGAKGESLKYVACFHWENIELVHDFSFVDDLCQGLAMLAIGHLFGSSRGTHYFDIDAAIVL
jgi:hypothetical protein